MENCGDFSIFLQAFVNKLWLTKKKKERMKERQNENFCNKISQLHEMLGKLQG